MRTADRHKNIEGKIWFLFSLWLSTTDFHRTICSSETSLILQCLCQASSSLCIPLCSLCFTVLSPAQLLLCLIHASVNKLLSHQTLWKALMSLVLKIMESNKAAHYAVTQESSLRFSGQTAEGSDGDHECASWQLLTFYCIYEFHVTKLTTFVLWAHWS